MNPVQEQWSCSACLRLATNAPKTLICRCYSKACLCWAWMSLEDSAFTIMPRKAIKFNQTLIESRSDLNWWVHIKILLTFFCSKDAVGCFEKFAHFCFSVQIMIQDQIIAAGIPFSGLCSFPSVWIRLYPVVSRVPSPAVDEIDTRWIKLGDKHVIAGPSLWETCAATVLQESLYLHLEEEDHECFLCPLLKNSWQTITKRQNAHISDMKVLW